MAKWMSPDEELPSGDCGDRVVGVVKYSEPYNDGFSSTGVSYGPVKPHIVVFVATEDGWEDVEGAGYDIYDCVLWTLESDLVRVVDVLSDGDPA